MKVIKRNGSEVEFCEEKIITAISKAGFVDDNTKQRIANEIKSLDRESISVEEIQDLVEKKLMETKEYIDVAREYVRYRYKREIIRNNTNQLDEQVIQIVNHKNVGVAEENSNKNPVILSTQRDYMAGEVSKQISNDLLLPDDIVEADREGIIHFHDKDYFAQRMHNCCLVNLEDMLQNGTVITGTMIEKPHSFSTACNIATQIMAQVASNQYGGQSNTLSHLAPFVDVSRQAKRKEVRQEYEEQLASGEIDHMPSDESINRVAEGRVRKEVRDGVQTIQYQILTLMTTNGQTPFVTIFMYLNEVPDGQVKDDLAMIIEEMLDQRYEGIKNEAGAWITPAFPKLVYVLEEDNIHDDSKYFYLTQKAAKCTAKRLVPDYVSEKKMLEYKVDANGEGHCYPPMGCRSFLTPYLDKTGKPKYYGRFNQGVVTINLVDVALSARKAMLEEANQYDEKILFDKFWEIFEDRLELCHRGLQQRHQRLRGTLSDVSPIHWQFGALARIGKGETIDELLYNGYSTLSLGYAGLYECVMAMTGKSHTDDEAKPFALDVMKKMNAKCKQWKEVEHIDYSLYGTPIESTTYKFAQCLQRRFGVIKDITDHDYITNSYHVNVREHIDPFTKLKFEAEFQMLSPGGAISYIETSDLTHNLEAVIKVMRYIYDNIIYAELNTKSDYCQVCGYDGEIKIIKEKDRLIWECPNCKNRDQRKMNVARRTCGYIGSQWWNQGRTEEIQDRWVHLGSGE